MPRGYHADGSYCGKIFEKGHIPWDKGIKRPEMTGDNSPCKRPDVREKISRTKRGKRYYKLRIQLSPSKELAYLLGVRYGDGRLSKIERYSMFGYGICAKDKDFVQEFKRCIDQVVKSKVRHGEVWQSKEGYYGYTVNSKMFYEFLNKPFEEHKPIIESVPAQFLRAFFDSEGSVVYSRPKARRKDMDLTCSNTNREILIYIQYILATKFSIFSVVRLSPSRRRGGRWKPLFTLHIRRNADQQRFANLVGFSIQRKQQKLVEGL